jgi:hypothetical protein
LTTSPMITKNITNCGGSSITIVETASSEFNEVLAQLIANLPPASVLSSNEYRSYDASTYDTLRQGYLPRMHSMIPVMRHRPYGTMSQRYATMDAQQQPALIGSAYNAEFRLISNMDADAAATYLRPEGLLYHIPSLYLSHYGEKEPLSTNSEVRIAIQALLVRDNLVNGRSPTVNLSSDRPFDEQELNCLLQALVSGTIQPDLYSGRALPWNLIGQLMEYIDHRTNQLMQYATQSDLRNRVEEDREPLALYITALKTDALYLATTGAYQSNTVIKFARPGLTRQLHLNFLKLTAVNFKTTC